MTELKRPNPFPNNRPQRHWYEGFLRRHKQISERVSQNLSNPRARVTEAQIRNWFLEIDTYLRDNDYLDIFKDPRRVYNCDETAFFLSPKGDKVLAKKGDKTVYSFITNDEKECLTALIMCNSKGELPPPLVMYSYKRIPKLISSTFPKSWAIGRSDNGWMTQESFFEYVANIFHPWLMNNNVKMPIILFVDGHTSHLTLQLSRFCKENGIILVSLFPNSTHILQPLDVAVFHSLKAIWKKKTQNWRIDHKDEKFGREHFAQLLKTALEDLETLPKSIQSGFKTCGLCPFGPENIKFEKFFKIEKTNVEEVENELIETDRIKFLKYFENINSAKIDLFKSSGPLWNGDIKDTSLFYFWKNLKNPNEQNLTHMSSPIVVVSVDSNNFNLADTTDDVILVDDNFFSAQDTDFVSLSDFNMTDVSVSTNDVNISLLMNGATCSILGDENPEHMKEVEESKLTNGNSLQNYEKGNELKKIITSNRSVETSENDEEIQTAIGTDDSENLKKLENINANSENSPTCSERVEELEKISETIYAYTLEKDKESDRITNIVDTNSDEINKLVKITETIYTETLEKSIESDIINYNTENPEQAEGLTNETISKNMNEMSDIPASTMVSENINKVDPEVQHESTTTSNTQIPVQKFELNDTTPDKSIEKKQSNVATPFKKYIFWESKETESNPRKRKPKEKIPAVVSSLDWETYQQRKEEKKLRELREKEERKQKRLEKNTKQTAEMDQKKKQNIDKKKKNDIKKGNDEEKKIKSNTKQKNVSESEDSESEDSGKENDSVQDIEYVMKKIDSSNLSEGDYIVVQYENVFYPGMVIKVDRLKKDFTVKCMTKAGTLWKWPTKDDVLTYSEKDLICAIKKPKMVTSRGLYDIPDFPKEFNF